MDKTRGYKDAKDKGAGRQQKLHIHKIRELGRGLNKGKEP